MKVGDLVRWTSDTFFPQIVSGGEIGVVVSIKKEPEWLELQVKVLWREGFWTQSIKNLEVINEGG